MRLLECQEAPVSEHPSGTNVSQTLTKTAKRHFSPNFPLIRDILSQKTSFLVRSEILGLLGNTLTTDHMYPSYN